MKLLLTWVARRKRRRMIRKYIDRLVAGAERHRDITREINETDFAAALVGYAVALGKHVEALTRMEKQQVVLNYVLNAKGGRRMNDG